MWWLGICFRVFCSVVYDCRTEQKLKLRTFRRDGRVCAEIHPRSIHPRPVAMSSIIMAVLIPIVQKCRLGQCMGGAHNSRHSCDVCVKNHLLHRHQPPQCLLEHETGEWVEANRASLHTCFPLFQSSVIDTHTLAPCCTPPFLVHQLANGICEKCARLLVLTLYGVDRVWVVLPVPFVMHDAVFMSRSWSLSLPCRRACVGQYCEKMCWVLNRIHKGVHFGNCLVRTSENGHSDNIPHPKGCAGVRLY